MKKPKISVVIPVYNREKILRQCLNSVLNQTYNNYEVIVVDNNSTDNTKKIIKKFQKKNKKIKYLFESKRGTAAARYKGEINSRGDIILMTDSDCIVPKNWIEEMIEPIVKNRAIAVQGLKKAIFLNYWTRNIEKEERRLVTERLKDKKVGLLDTANFAIKKSVLKKAGYTNPDVCSVNDTELDTRLKIKGYEIYFKEVKVLHHHPDTALSVFKKQFKRGELNARLRKTYKAYKELFLIPSKVHQLCYFIGIGSELLCLHKNFKYDFITGMGWRIGLVYGYLWGKNYFKNINK
ncbi:MAG: glycosyltransferase [Candidatus Hodarchaeota archaeon]